MFIDKIHCRSTTAFMSIVPKLLNEFLCESNTTCEIRSEWKQFLC